MDPVCNDIVAFESFARQNSFENTIHPSLLPSLEPLLVINVNCGFLLVEYTSLPIGKKYRIRVSRNAVFVIERTSLQDSLIDLTLKPLDLVGSTPLGNHVMQELSPLSQVVEELSMPAILT